MLLLLPASAEQTRRAGVSSSVQIASIQYAPETVIDRYEPATIGARAPVFVLLHGCCGDRRDLAGLARALARRGNVVLNPDIHNLRDGGGWPKSYEDAICAASRARKVARQLDRGPHYVVMIGWSDGALIGATVTLGWDALAPSVTRCAVDRSATPPDLFIGLSGYYGWPDVEVPADVVNEGTIRWFGARPSDDPNAWRAGNAWSWIGVAGADHRPSFLLLSGTDDPLAAGARMFAAGLLAHGLDVSTVEIPGGTHLGLAQPRSDEGALALVEITNAIAETLGSGRPRLNTEGPGQ